MLTGIYKFSAPKYCYQLAEKLQPWFAIICLVLFVDGLWQGLVMAPPDYQQGDVYRIIYLHVPLAIWSLGIYVVMAACSLLYFIWKIKIADIIAKVSAPIGALFTLLTLISGSIWGKPTWGTWWIWDARLTSELILLFIYFGIIAVRHAMPEPRLASRAAALVTLVGSVNIPIVHYSVNWWNTLHQGASILKLGSPSIAPSMLHPLLVMITAFLFYYLWILTIQIKSELLCRDRKTQWVALLLNEGEHA